MKTISLKMPDDVYERMEKYRKSMDKNRSAYVMEAVVEYTRQKEREELRKQLQEEAQMTAEERAKFEQEMEVWNVTLMDGLEEDDWPEYNTPEFLEKLKNNERGKE